MSKKPEFLEDVNPVSRQFPTSWRDYKIRELRVPFSKNITCPLCCTIYKELNDIQKFEADHIEPYSKGGKTIWENLQVICRNCNRIKSNSLPRLRA